LPIEYKSIDERECGIDTKLGGVACTSAGVKKGQWVRRTLLFCVFSGILSTGYLWSWFCLQRVNARANKQKELQNERAKKNRKQKGYEKRKKKDELIPEE
jgi:hypothetical protein